MASAPTSPSPIAADATGRTEPDAQAPVYRNRRRIRGARGRRLMRRRGERIERPSRISMKRGHAAHASARPHEHLKRVLIHAGGFNLGLVMRRADRRRHAARPPRPFGGCDRDAFGAHGRSHDADSPRSALGSDSRGHARLVTVTDHARGQLVSGGDLSHGQLAAVARLRRVRASDSQRLGTGSGRQGPGPSCRARAEVSKLRQIRVAVVMRNALGSDTFSRSAACQRKYVSCPCGLGVSHRPKHAVGETEQVPAVRLERQGRIQHRVHGAHAVRTVVRRCGGNVPSQPTEDHGDSPNAWRRRPRLAHCRCQHHRRQSPRPVHR